MSAQKDITGDDIINNRGESSSHLYVSASVTLVLPTVKGKVIPLHAMEALGVRGSIDPTHS
jgi:hypothetical protein